MTNPPPFLSPVCTASTSPMQMIQPSPCGGGAHRTRAHAALERSHAHACAPSPLPPTHPRARLVTHLGGQRADEAHGRQRVDLHHAIKVVGVTCAGCHRSRCRSTTCPAPPPTHTLERVLLAPSKDPGVRNEYVDAHASHLVRELLGGLCVWGGGGVDVWMGAVRGLAGGGGGGWGGGGGGGGGVGCGGGLGGGGGAHARCMPLLPPPAPPTRVPTPWGLPGRRAGSRRRSSPRPCTARRSGGGAGGRVGGGCAGHQRASGWRRGGGADPLPPWTAGAPPTCCSSCLPPSPATRMSLPAPARANAHASVDPRPRLAPVMSTVRPCTRSMVVVGRMCVWSLGGLWVWVWGVRGSE